MPPSTALRRSLLALALSIASVACSDGGRGADTRQVTRVELRPDDTTPLARDTVLYKSLPFPDDGSWVVTGADAFGIDHPATPAVGDGSGPSAEAVQRVLHVAHAEQPKRILIRGPFEVSKFNRVEVDIAGSEQASIRAVLILRGRRRFGDSGRQPMPVGSELKTMVFEMPVPDFATGPIDDIALVVDSKPGPFVIAGIRLVHRPVTARFADPAEPAELIEVRHEARRGKLVTSRSPLRGRFDSPGEGFLSIGYATPPVMYAPKSRPVITVTLEGTDGRSRVEHYGLSYTEVGALRWLSARIPLADLGAQPVDLSFELSGDPESVAYAAIEEPRVTRLSPRAPSVLFVTSDTHRGDHVGAASPESKVLTPTLDALAARGVLFERAWSTTNVTNPSHIALMTAAHPRDHGILDNLEPVNDSALTLAECFRDAGYLTFSAVAAPHLAPRASGLGQGFDRALTPFDTKGRIDDSLDRLDGWLAEAAYQPVFVWLHLFDAHAPYGPPEPFDRMYRRGNRDPFDPQLALPKQADPRLLRQNWLRGLRDFSWPTQQYMGEVSALDEALGRLLSRPRFRDGIVAFTSDHGESMLEHDILWDHAELYPSTLSVPLILSWPGGPRGARVRKEVTTLNVGRTLLDLAGVEAEAFPGENLIRAAAEERDRSEPVFALSASAISASVRRGDEFLVLHLREHPIDPNEVLPRRLVHETEYYVMTHDPDCENDLAAGGSPPEEAKALRKLLSAWLRAAKPLDWSGGANTDAALAFQLGQLGYAQGGSGDAREAMVVEPDCDCSFCAAWR